MSSLLHRQLANFLCTVLLHSWNNLESAGIVDRGDRAGSVSSASRHEGTGCNDQCVLASAVLDCLDVDLYIPIRARVSKSHLLHGFAPHARICWIMMWY